MEYVHRRFRAAVDALEHLVGGLGTAVLALGALFGAVVVAAACVGGVGLLLVPGMLRAVRSVADRERARLSRWGPPIPGRPARCRPGFARRCATRSSGGNCAGWPPTERSASAPG